MKYSELISFHPIEDVIQLTTANDAEQARGYVKSYVMSDAMAEKLRAPVLDQLQMDEVIDNKGVLIVGNYGTGKSHLMSVISAVAHDASNLDYVQNRKFAAEMQPIAGKFEVLRIEIGGVTMSLRNIIFDYVEEDFAKRGIDFTVPDFDKVKDNKKLLRDMMYAFAEKYPDRGYLIVVDEFLAYLSTRDEREIVLDLEFLRALGEMCSKSKLRIILGVQEKIFDNPRFSFVSNSLKHVSDRFTQIMITKEDTSYVVSERILKKTPEQKALIREHLEKFSSLYSGMSPRMEEFVSLYPIHPAYIEVFNKIYVIENRHVLKNISLAIKNIFDTDVPEDAPGIISFDDYWPAIRDNGLLKSDVTISRVVAAGTQLEEIINRSFPKKVYKPLAIKIIYALCVHRLTTNGLDVRIGLTAENLKDDLCLFLPMPEMESDFLLGTVNNTLKEIMTTVSGQFIIHNEANDQYYIDVDKTVDYEEKIRQKASLMADSELNRYFYDVVYSCMEWDAKQYVTNFNIYEYDLNWNSHNIFREGYLFMGLPGERSTAQPEQDFYIHIMPIYDDHDFELSHVKDEVYLCFNPTAEFREQLSLYSAARSLALISEGKDRDAYTNKAGQIRKKLIKYLNDNKSTCFDVMYCHQRRQMMEVLKGRHNQAQTFKDTIDLAASMVFDPYFCEKYPEFPVMKTRITRRNRSENSRAAFDCFAGRKTQQASAMLQSFNLLEGDKLRPENSKYTRYYINKIQELPPQGVLNFSDLFDVGAMDECFDKKFHISYLYTPIIFLALVAGGYANLTLKNGTTLTASTLDQVPRIGQTELHEFKYISRPTDLPLPELKALFELLGISTVLLDLPKEREKGVEQLQKRAQELCNSAVMAEQKLGQSFALWGEPLINSFELNAMKSACKAVSAEFSNYGAKYNTPAKLNNFNRSLDEIKKLGEQITKLNVIDQYVIFKNECAALVGYLSGIEHLDLGDEFRKKFEDAKKKFREERDLILYGVEGLSAAYNTNTALIAVREAYISIYFDAHKKKRLGVRDAQRKGKLQSGSALSNLKRLRGLDKVVSGQKLNLIEKNLASLQVCYELTPEELRGGSVCPHCHFSLNDHAVNVYGQLDNIENSIDQLTDEWTSKLLDTVSDPLVIGQKEYLSADQQRVIDSFIASGKLPKKVDDFFVGAVQALLKGFDPVVISVDELTAQLEALPPMDEKAFMAKVQSIVQGYTKGKDAGKLRIIVKREE